MLMDETAMSFYKVAIFSFAIMGVFVTKAAKNDVDLSSFMLLYSMLPFVVFVRKYLVRQAYICNKVWMCSILLIKLNKQREDIFHLLPENEQEISISASWRVMRR